jgi:DNA processing protein
VRRVIGELQVEQNDSVRDWIALSLVPGIGRRTAVLLTDRFESPASCFEASSGALESAGLKRESIDAMKSGEPRARADSELEELAKLGGKVLVLSDPEYPILLRETFDPPVVLYYLGDLPAALARPAIAIVGSRRCSTYGRNAGEMLGRELAQRGVTIVSGLARGIDSSAHRGALEGGGLTIGVMGTGLDSVYPKENRKLADAIAKQGALLTEFPLGTPPLSQNFPFRNRVLSGLSLGVVVVEAAERSGSLITARMAYEQGRDVFAIPGNITSSKSFGPNYLIKDGAKLVQTWQDVVEEFPIETRARILSIEKNGHGEEQAVIEEVVLSDAERKLLAMIKPDEAIHIDQLIHSSKLSSPDLMGALLKLEMSDRIRQLPGKCFVRKL